MKRSTKQKDILLYGRIYLQMIYPKGSQHPKYAKNAYNLTPNTSNPIKEWTQDLIPCPGRGRWGRGGSSSERSVTSRKVRGPGGRGGKAAGAAAKWTKSNLAISGACHGSSLLPSSQHVGGSLGAQGAFLRPLPSLLPRAAQAPALSGLPWLTRSPAVAAPLSLVALAP